MLGGVPVPVGVAELYQAILPWNAHWTGGPVSPLVRKNEQRRRVFYPLQKLLMDPTRREFRILAGPRQIGKTTTVGHLMQSLLDAGVEPHLIVYCPVDLPRVQAETKGQTAILVELMERLLLKAPLSSSGENVFLFLDEIHTLDDWANQLKGLHDAYHPVLRLVATGSSSAALLNPEADLPGRAVRHDLYPLKFNEALEVSRPEQFGHETDLFRTAMAARRTLAKATFEEREKVRVALELVWFEMMPVWGEIEPAFDRFLLQGGYPASWMEDDARARFAFMESTLATAFSKDLKHFPGIRKPGAFSEFLGALARDHGGKFSSNAYANDLGLDKETPAHWKQAAEELFLVRQLRPTGPDLRPLPRKMDKAYIQDAGIRAYLSAEFELADLERTGRIGAVLEGVVFDHLNRILFSAFNSRRFDLGYLPRPEVDFVARLPHAELLIECKYRGDPDDGIRALARVLPDREALRIVVTRHHFDTNGDVWCIPAALLCYIA